MHIIHFTQGATDPLTAFDSQGVRFVPLADGAGDCHISCVHLEPGAKIDAPSLTHAVILMVVHGRITVTSRYGMTCNVNIHAGMGFVVEPEKHYSLRSDISSIFLLVEADKLCANSRGISSPQRIAGHTWPSDVLLTDPA